MLIQLFGELPLEALILLLVLCFFSAILDSIAGGGGLISLPAFLATGLPPHIALGTNKLAAFFSTSSSSIHFMKSGNTNKKILLYLMPFSFIGAILGTKTVLLMDPNKLYPLIIVGLIVVLAYSVFNKKLGCEDNCQLHISPVFIIQGVLFALLIGFYDGFLGPGTGSFLIFGLIKIFNLDFIKAAGNSKILNLSSNVASVITYTLSGKVNITYAILAGLVMIIGSQIGARLATSRGTSFIKPVFLVATGGVLIKLVSPYVAGFLEVV